MSDLPVESRAFRQRLMAGLLGFFLGLIALLAPVVYVAFLAKRHEGWLPALPICLHLLTGLLALSGLVAVFGAVLTELMKMLHMGDRVRPRASEFLTVLIVWPILGGAFILCRELLH